jgi:hypothetical protein
MPSGSRGMDHEDVTVAPISECRDPGALPPIDGILRIRYIACVAYGVECTDEFTGWWDGLTEGEQIAVAKVVGVLVEHGPDLKRPYVGKIEGSKRLPNLKELIVQYAAILIECSSYLTSADSEFSCSERRKPAAGKLRTPGTRRELPKWNLFTKRISRN